MDHQWQSRTVESSICPMCSVSHFPFCPPHPQYRFPSQSDYPPRPHHANFGRVSPIMAYDYGNSNSNSNGYVVGEVDRNHKRPRVDDSVRVSSDDERRLKLIRDHGGFSPGPPLPTPPPPRIAGHVGQKQHYVPVNRRNEFCSSQPLPAPPPPPPSMDYWQAFSVSNQVPQQQNHYGMQQSNYTLQNGNYVSPVVRQYHSYSIPDQSMNESTAYLPPLPASPPPPLPVDPPFNHSSEFKAYSSPPSKTPRSLFPVPISSSPAAPSILPHAAAGLVSEESRAIHHQTAMQFVGEGQSFPVNQLSPEKRRTVDASHLFKHPYRATRPDHLVIILRGLPGSGKSYLAKLLRDLEVENGGDAPRIHSMDDYFLTEVEKAEESDVSKSSSSLRSKKTVVKKVMEYCYEPEMEEAYRSSMLKAFKRTLEEGIFTFIMVDDRNLRVADFAQFWAIAKRSGYEVYILEATYRDPAGCAARNVHGFTLDEIQKMAGQWEEAPSLYMQLDIKSLFHGDDLKESGIQEVVMDMVDGEVDEGPCEQREGKPGKIEVPSVEDGILNDPPHGEGWGAEGDCSTEVKALGRSKWSDDLDNDDTEKSEGLRNININSLSGLIRVNRKGVKSVRWADQNGDTGFSIGAAKKAILTLVIGPGPGYNLKSNPLPEVDCRTSSSGTGGKLKKQSVFNDRLRAEHESFKAVFDRRRQRIGLDLEEE